MDGRLENIVNDVLESIAKGYTYAKKDWMTDKKNLFKDGKLLGYYEAKEAVLRVLDADEPLENALEAIAGLYSSAKVEWLSDRRNAFKDGKFLACYEILNMVPAAN